MLAANRHCVHPLVAIARVAANAATATWHGDKNKVQLCNRHGISIFAISLAISINVAEKVEITW